MENALAARAAVKHDSLCAAAVHKQGVEPRRHALEVELDSLHVHLTSGPWTRACANKLVSKESAQACYCRRCARKTVATRIITQGHRESRTAGNTRVTRTPSCTGTGPALSSSSRAVSSLALMLTFFSPSSAAAAATLTARPIAGGRSCSQGSRPIAPHACNRNVSCQSDTCRDRPTGP